MKLCSYCYKSLKNREFDEHLIQHESPKRVNDKIMLSGGHQVVLLLKGHDTWEEYFKKHCRKNKDISWLEDGKKLEQFESEQHIEFLYCKRNDELSFEEIKSTPWQKIQDFFRNISIQ